MSIGRCFKVFHKIAQDKMSPYSVIMESKFESALMFESGVVITLSSSEMDEAKKGYTKVFDAYGCLGVMTLKSSQSSDPSLIQYLVIVTGCLSIGKIGNTEVLRVSQVNIMSLRNEPSDAERVGDLRKLLSSGIFYFSRAADDDFWDLSLSAQCKLHTSDSGNRNRTLHAFFQRYGVDCDRWLLRVICGGVEIRTVYVAHCQAKACLVSRLSWQRAGTRFNVRGVNDDGHVANFVETEQVIVLDRQVTSFLQIRGSVPLFWEQPGINVGSHKVTLSRCRESSAPAYERHLRLVKQHYGDAVIVNLLGSKEGERKLSQYFQEHHCASTFCHTIPFIHFDYHGEVKWSNTKSLDNLCARLLKSITGFGFFYASDPSCADTQRKQTGTIRTNCLDCLDRTNAVQTMVGMEVLLRQLECLGLTGKPLLVARFEEAYRQMWQNNGDHISHIYAGTGALGGGRSKYSDASRSAARAIQNNFLDSSKQEAMDILLSAGGSVSGDLADKSRAFLTPSYVHVSTNILESMVQRVPEYSEPHQLRICIATYNVNGSGHFRSILTRHLSLADWLLDAHRTHPESTVKGYDYEQSADVFAVGFQEIIDLNASNIVKASTRNAADWMKEVGSTISRRTRYIMLTHIQLVGVALFIYIRPHLSHHIRDVAVDKVKTGLGGATGNKGGVGIRFLLQSTSFCFVCSHLAAGQSQVNDRNADYSEIIRRMSFSTGRSILSHDYVFWCGDLNYRIDMPLHDIVQLSANQNWTTLQQSDQLNVQKAAGKIFSEFMEGATNFTPTYRYELFSNDWDNKDNRMPAWTDRVLWRQQPHCGLRPNAVTQLLYTRAELTMSDHRPVVALFEAAALTVDERKKEKVFGDVVDQEGPSDAAIFVSMPTGARFDLGMFDTLVERFKEVGEVVVAQCLKSEVLLIFRSGKIALKALRLNQQQVQGQVIRVRLKTPEWREIIVQEMKLHWLNNRTLSDAVTNSLLGEDFNSSQVDITLEEEGDGDVVVSVRGDLLGAASHFGSDLITATMTDVDKEEECSVATVLRQPPERPKVPPSKLPPPRPTTSPSLVPTAMSNSGVPDSCKVSCEKPQMIAPLRDCHVSATSTINTKKHDAKIRSISRPMNVQHAGHAKTVEEAELLMSWLMKGGVERTGGGSPQSLKHSSSTSCLPSDHLAGLSSCAPRHLPRRSTRFTHMDTDTLLGSLHPSVSTTESVIIGKPTLMPRAVSFGALHEQNYGNCVSLSSLPCLVTNVTDRSDVDVDNVGLSLIVGPLQGEDVDVEHVSATSNGVIAVTPSVETNILDTPNLPCPQKDADPFDTNHLLDSVMKPSINNASKCKVTDPFDVSHAMDPFYTFTTHETGQEVNLLEMYKSTQWACDMAKTGSTTMALGGPGILKNPFDMSTMVAAAESPALQIPLKPVNERVMDFVVVPSVPVTDTLHPVSVGHLEKRLDFLTTSTQALSQHPIEDNFSSSPPPFGDLSIQQQCSLLTLTSADESLASSGCSNVPIMPHRPKTNPFLGDDLATFTVGPKVPPPIPRRPPT